MMGQRVAQGSSIAQMLLTISIVRKNKNRHCSQSANRILEYKDIHRWNRSDIGHEFNGIDLYMRLTYKNLVSIPNFVFTSFFL